MHKAYTMAHSAYGHEQHYNYNTNYRGRGNANRGCPWPSMIPQNGSQLMPPSMHQRPLPHLMELDYLSPNKFTTWPPPDVQEFGVEHSQQFPPWHGPPRGGAMGWNRGGRDFGRGRGGRGNKRKNQHNDNSPHPKEKKAKSGKDDNAKEDLPYFCDACDRGFVDKIGLDGHLASHTTCGMNGCPYVACSKLVKLHQDMQHKTGLAHKIWKLESKESIEKWKQERRKNFPTVERVEEKKAEEAVRVERGDVLETKSFGKFRRGGNDRGRGRGRGRGQGQSQEGEGNNNERAGGRGRGRGQRWNRGRGRGNQRDDSDTCQPINHHSNTQPVQQHSNTQPINHHSINRTSKDNSGHTMLATISASKKTDVSGDPLALFANADDKSDGEADTEVMSKPSGIGGALGALMAVYDDDSDQDEEEAPNMTAQSAGVVGVVPPDASETDEFVAADPLDPLDPPQTDHQTADTLTVDHAVSTSYVAVLPSDDDKNEDHPSESHDHEIRGDDDTRGRKGYCRGNRGRGRGRGSRNNGVPQGRFKKSSLLEKLLAPEIRHERNVVLQCIRYICKNNFFEQLTEVVPHSSDRIEV